MARVPTWCNWWTFLPFRRLPFWRTWRSFSYLMMWILSLNMFIMMSEMPLRRSTCPANFITKSLTILSCISGASVEQGWKWIYINQTKKYQSLSLLSKLYQLIIWPFYSIFIFTVWTISIDYLTYSLLHFRKHPQIPKLLNHLRTNDKKVFLITNSPFHFVDKGELE